MADHMLDAEPATAAPPDADRAGRSGSGAPRPPAAGGADHREVTGDRQGLEQRPAHRPGSADGALPPGPPYFAGRRRELRQLRADIDRPGLAALRGEAPATCRVLLVAGRPGSGRTALAVRLAAELAPRYPGGRFFARLTTGDGQAVPTERVVRELLRAVGVPVPDEAPPEQAAGTLRAALADRAVLLVLDDAATADQVLPLLPGDPRSLVVVTSEGPLPAVPDVRPCTLGGLDTAACVELLAKSAGPTRVSCDPTAAAALTEECAAGPTALRLVAGLLAARPGMSVSDAVRLLRATPDGLPDSDLPPSPVVRALRLVHDQLPRPTARMLRLLSLAPGGVADAQLASALAGCSLSTAESLLAELVRHGLLHPQPTAAALPRAHRVPGCLHPLLLALAGAHERPAELRLARARLLERSVRLLHSCRGCAAPAGSPARKQLAALPRSLRFRSAEAAGEWLRLWLPELLAAVRTAVTDGELDTLARRLATALVRALDTHGCGGGAAWELYALHGLLREVAERRGLPREKAAALINLADLDTRAGRTAQALDRYRAALDAARQAGDGFAAVRALESVAAGYLELGDGDRAADWYGRALALRQARGELAEQARLHARLGALHTGAGRHPDALREWRAAAAVYRRLRDVPAQVRALGEVARVHGRAGQFEEALRSCQEALRWARQLGDPQLEGTLLLCLAEALDGLGDPAGAGLQRSAAARLLGGTATADPAG